MATPPFTLDATLPQASNLISQYPTQSQAWRDTVKSWLNLLSTDMGIIKLTALPTDLGPRDIAHTSAGALRVIRSPTSTVNASMIFRIEELDSNIAIGQATEGIFAVGPTATLSTSGVFRVNTATGQVEADGSIVAANVVYADGGGFYARGAGRYIGNDSIAVLAAGAGTGHAGTIYLRPDGTTSTTSQVIADADGLLTGGNYQTTAGQVIVAAEAGGLSSAGVRLNSPSTPDSTTSMTVVRSANPAARFSRTTSNGPVIEFYRGTGNFRGDVTANGTGVVYGSASDRRLKSHIEPLSRADAVALIEQLQPRSFIWKANAQSGIGFVADEIQMLFPDSVSGEPESEHMQTVDAGSGEVIAALVATVQDLLEWRALFDDQCRAALDNDV